LLSEQASGHPPRILAALRSRLGDRALVAALAVLAFALALLQRPGLTSSDTKIDLHVDPVGFLGDVASAWSSTGDLGHVQGGQYGGYLFPMGPFFAVGHVLGLGPWLVQRLWLGLILALAAWGAVKLMDELAGRPRGVAHAVTGLLFLLNPYVVVFSARTSVTLLGYAALPWLLVCVRRGIHANPWWWAAAFALVVTASGGGVNAAVTAWMLAGPLLLALYERWIGTTTWRDLWAFGWRTTLAAGLVSAWWVVPLLVQSRFGVDFLRFTEQPGTIWSTTSLPESLRLMGYWISYLGVGYGGELRPYFGDGGVLLFSLPVVLAGLLVPAITLTGFAWTRRHPYGPFALLLALAGLLIMTAGFPEGTPLRKASNFTYNHFLPVQFLRTTYKAGPLVVVGIAILAGLAAAKLPRKALLVAALVLPLVASWPLIRGRGVDDQLLWKSIPSAWRQAADHVDQTAGDGRAVVLPGQLYAYYDWGGTIDPILPVLTDKPVATRNSVGYADLRATDLLWTVDALVQQRRVLPEQLPSLLDLLGARTVLAGADDDRTRSGAAPAAEAADALEQLGRPNGGWGEQKARPRAAGTLGDPVTLPRVRAWDRPGAPGLVRIEQPDPQLIVDGSAEGLAAFSTPNNLPLSGFDYAADVSTAALRRAKQVVITDSNRRRVLVPSRLAQNAGPVLAADVEPSVDAAVLNPFPERGSDAQTVAVYEGIAGVQAPSSPGFPQFPERRPFAALDGDPATHWQADRALTPDLHTLKVTFERPRDVPYVDLTPYSDRRAKVVAVEIAGRRHPVHPGSNHLSLGLRNAPSLEVRLDVHQRPGPTATGGIRELAIPGVKATEALRPPVLAERALKGQDLERTGLTYVFQRTTGDDPFRRDPTHGTASAVLVRDRGDAERGLERIIAPPAAREWAINGWVTTAPDAPDAALDAIVGVKGTFNSSGRFEGRPGSRASSAFDGTKRAWIGSWQDGRQAWLEWESERPASLQRLTLDPVRGVRRATQVWLKSESGQTPPLTVAPDGTVRLSQPLRGRRFRLEILRAAWPQGTPGSERQRRAVGIAELRGAGVPSVKVRRDGNVAVDCSAITVTVGGKRVGLALHLRTPTDDLDAGRPLRVGSCKPFSLPAGETRVSAQPGVFTPYVLRMISGGGREPSSSPGKVVSAGTATRGGREGVRLKLDAPARLVLAESYNRGRRATCDGKDLGTPEVGGLYGTAWRVPKTCQDVTITFAPNRLVNAGYAISLLAGLLLLALVLLRRPGPRPVELEPHEPAEARKLPAGQAALIAIPIAVAFGFAFAARGTPLFAVGVFLVLWRGVGARELALAGGAALAIAVPILTVLIRPDNRGGYNPEYSIDGVAVHWVAVAGVSLLILALARALSTARARTLPARSAPPSAAAPPGPAP
jgi:arabinofuranan 3-O-arabinosyltransferase